MRVVPLVLALLLAGCRSDVARQVPEPLPESLDAWSAAPTGGAYLGIKGQENDSGSLEDLFFQPGVRVLRVVENSPAATAGVRPGDVVLAVGGREIDDPGALDALVAGRAAGERVVLRVQRDDAVYDVEVELDARGEASLAPPEKRWLVDRARSGAAWAAAPGGVRLVSAAERGPVGRAGIPAGSVVTALDGEAVLSDRELLRRLAARDPGDDVRFEYVAPDGTEGGRVVELHGPTRYVAELSVPVLVHYAHDPEGPTTDFALVDLWIVSLFRYHREGKEKTWSFLRFFRFSSGIGELSE